VRVRSLQASKKGCGFAFNAGASVDSSSRLLDSAFDGLYCGDSRRPRRQFLRDIRECANNGRTKESSAGLLAGAGVDTPSEQFLAATHWPRDPQTEFNLAVKQKVQDFLNDLNQLDHRAATADQPSLWSMEAARGQNPGHAAQISQLDQSGIDGMYCDNLS